MKLLEIKQYRLFHPDYNLDVKLNDFYLMENERVALVANSGSGKTQFVQSLFYLSIVPAQFTSIHYKGQDLTYLFQKQKRTSFQEESFLTFQNAKDTLHPTISIQKQLIQYYCFVHQCKKEEAYESIETLLQQVHIQNLDYFKKVYAYQLSLGMCQRIQLVFLLMSKKKIWIFDEITSSLDIILKQEILQMISEFQNQYQTTILMITHDQNKVANFCDRIISL